MYGTGLATTLEEMARNNEGIIANCLNLMLHSTLADRLWSPWKVLASSPAIAAAGILIGYIIFLIFFLPLYLISCLLTSYGSVLFLMALIVVGARSLARSMTFPGSTLSVQREISTDFMRKLSIQLENVSKMTGSLTSTLMLIASGKSKKNDANSILGKLDESYHLITVLPMLSVWLEGALKVYIYIYIYIYISVNQFIHV
jgi:hypothetical protein